MKNIYILDESQSSTRNGIGTFLRELLKCFEGHNVCLIEFNSDEKAFGIKTHNGVREMHFPIFIKNGFLANYKIIEKLFRLHIADSSDNLFMVNHSPCENLLKALKAAFPLSKITFTIHDFGWTSRLSGDFDKLKNIISEDSHNKIKKQYQPVIDYFHEEQRMYEVADKVICLSDDSFKILQELYRVEKNKISFIPNGLTDTHVPISPSKKRALKIKMGVRSDEKILIVVGRATPVKGVPCLLNAFTKVIKQYPDCRLIVVGQVYDPALILKLSEQVAAQVSYTGLIGKKELTRWYKVADIGVVSSLSEQCSYSGIEMMMHGLPVVASDGFGVRSMFQDGINARVAKIGNRKKPKEFEMNLSTAILELLLSETSYKQLNTGARLMYESRYTPQTMQEGYRKLLESINKQK